MHTVAFFLLGSRGKIFNFLKYLETLKQNTEVFLRCKTIGNREKKKHEANEPNAVDLYNFVSPNSFLPIEIKQHFEVARK